MKLLIKSTLALALIMAVSCTNSKPEQKQNNKSNIEKTTPSPKEKGMEYALKTKAVLGKGLMNAIKANGTEGALSFCNENATDLTNSVASKMNFTIKRVSDKYRNPNNKANVNELAYIENAKNQLVHGDKITPQIQEIDNKIVGYYPITINKKCLQCHGNPTSEIQPKTMSKIKELYPDDLAIGYSADELRGVWVVTMPKQ
ncbi:MAG: DUF3365 domain-containing protein [Flavobacteriaceae bacterium]|nr:DUF3365 domain-containing protein [Flavobacteriaceae bacterium]